MLCGDLSGKERKGPKRKGDICIWISVLLCCTVETQHCEATVLQTFYFYWSTVVLQICVSFYCTGNKSAYIYIYLLPFGVLKCFKISLYCDLSLISTLNFCACAFSFFDYVNYWSFSFLSFSLALSLPLLFSLILFNIIFFLLQRNQNYEKYSIPKSSIPE